VLNNDGLGETAVNFPGCGSLSSGE
jgi:hypothetical protein